MRTDSATTFVDIDPGQALAARGGALRTFSGLALLISLVLLVVGVYLIEDEFTNPLASQSLELFAAAFLLASAMALVHELIHMPRNLWRNQPPASAVAKKVVLPTTSKEPTNRSAGGESNQKVHPIPKTNPAVRVPSTPKPADKPPNIPNPRVAERPQPSRTPLRDRSEQRRDLPYQRCYVDHVRVRA
jgi:outer membrane biosynthesis protein TonB